MVLKPSELAYLRHEKGLPYVKLSIRKRVYLEDDLMEWFKGRRTVADLTQTPLPTSPDTPATSRHDTPQTQENTGERIIKDHAISDTD